VSSGFHGGIFVNLSIFSGFPFVFYPLFVCQRFLSRIVWSFHKFWDRDSVEILPCSNKLIHRTL
jgi:hypothetical protein